MRRTALSVAAVAACTLMVVGCAGDSPAEKAAKLRARYQVEVTGLVVREVPLAMPAAPPADEVAAAGPTAAAAADAAAEPVASEPVAPVAAARPTVLLDLTVRHDSAEKLSRLTVDITQVGPDGKTEKGRFHRTLDVGGIEKGPGNQLTVTLEDVSYEAGDGFAVEVRAAVPAAEQAEYPELAGG